MLESTQCTYICGAYLCRHTDCIQQLLGSMQQVQTSGGHAFAGTHALCLYIAAAGKHAVHEQYCHACCRSSTCWKACNAQAIWGHAFAGMHRYLEVTCLVSIS